jgi:putative ABC transport system ATP-binding protein
MIITRAGGRKRLPTSLLSRSVMLSSSEERTDGTAVWRTRMPFLERPGSPASTQGGPAPPAAVAARGIGRRDPNGQNWLIRDVSFAVNLGQRLALLGPTGAGKTVLLRALALLDPVDAGSVVWQGRAVAGDAVPCFRKQVVYVHQRPALFDGSVEDNLRHPFTLKAHRGSRFDRERVLELLDGLGRGAAFLGSSSRDLSGGEAQLVALVRAVQLDPAVLLLDEPTASLDQVTAKAVEGLLDRWFAAAAGRRALVWVSHNPDQARRVASEWLTMRSGRLDTR